MIYKCKINKCFFYNKVQPIIYQDRENPGHFFNHFKTLKVDVAQNLELKFMINQGSELKKVSF